MAGGANYGLLGPMKPGWTLAPQGLLAQPQQPGGLLGNDWVPGGSASVDPAVLMQMGGGAASVDPNMMGQVRQAMLSDNALKSLWTGTNPDSPQWANALAGGLNLAMMAGPHGVGPLHGSLGLLTDYASRMGRAKDMGFRTDQTVYHGSANPDITAFDPGRGGATSGSAVGRMGVSVALEPEVADEFAQIAAQKSGGNAQTYPLLVRKSKAAAITLDGSEKNNEIAATLGDAWDNGYDAVLLRNYTTPGGKTGKNVLIVKDPAQLRSPAAKFDPAKRGSADIMSSLETRPSVA